jgi:hypothetical protein
MSMTVTVADMPGCNLQKNGNVPAVVKVNVKLWPWVRNPLSHTPDKELGGVPDVDVCVEASCWTHFTVAPTSMARS